MGLIDFLGNVVGFLNGAILPFIVAVAGFAFIWNVFQLFIVRGGNTADHEKARTYVIWSFAGFVLMVSFWGIIYLLTNNLFRGMDSAETSDYQQVNGITDGINLVDGPGTGGNTPSVPSP